MITIKLGSWAKHYVSELLINMELENLDTAEQIAIKIGIPKEEIGFIQINGSIVEQNTKLKDGDILVVHPLIIGG